MPIFIRNPQVSDSESTNIGQIGNLTAGAEQVAKMSQSMY